MFESFVDALSVIPYYGFIAAVYYIVVMYPIIKIRQLLARRRAARLAAS